jgi:hypothetical protein
MAAEWPELAKAVPVGEHSEVVDRVYCRQWHCEGIRERLVSILDSFV